MNKEKLLNPRPEIRGRLLRFICATFLLSLVLGLLFTTKLVFTIIFGAYPLYLSINLFFQSFGYDPFHRITNTIY